MSFSVHYTAVTYLNKQMNMTFGDLFDYKLSLLFSAWNIETRGEFAIAWFGVCGSAVLYHGMKRYAASVEEKVHAAHAKRSREQFLVNTLADSGERIALISTATNSSNDSSYPNPNRVYGSEDCGGISNLLLLRVWHAVLSGLTYGLALLLMLVAMTYNCMLFLALIVGYTIGDFLFSIYGGGEKAQYVDCH